MNITAAMGKALEALYRAKGGLIWYANEHPESRDGNDDESVTEINAAISSLSEAIAAAEECKPVAGLLVTKVNFGAPDTRDIENGWEPLYPAAGVQPKPKQEPAAYLETITGQVRLPTDEHRVRFPKAYRPLYTSPRQAEIDDLRAALQKRETEILEQQRVLNKALRTLQSCFGTFRNNGFAYDKVIDAIEAIQENLK